MRRPATERTAWSATRTVRSMRSSGIANGRPSASTISAAMIASVSGRRIWAFVPLPYSEVIMTSPPSPRIAARTASMPTPRPEMSERDLGGREARGEQQLHGARHVDRVDRGRVDQPALGGLRRRRVRASMPRPSSATVMITLPPACWAEISSVPVAGLPAATRSSDAFEAVVERVADEVHERIAERVDHGAVELGVLAHELQVDLLAELGREVAHEPREAQEDGLHGDHPDLHDHRLQGVRRAREVLHGLREARHVGLGDQRLDLRAVQDELAHEVHQLVEPLGVDADRRGAAVLLVLLRAGFLAAGRGAARPASRSGRGRRLAGGHVGLDRGDVDRRSGDLLLDLVGRVQRGVGDGLEDVDLGDLGHGRDGVLDLGVGALGDDPRVDVAAVEGVDVVGRRGRT